MKKHRKKRAAPRAKVNYRAMYAQVSGELRQARDKIEFQQGEIQAMKETVSNLRGKVFQGLWYAVESAMRKGADRAMDVILIRLAELSKAEAHAAEQRKAPDLGEQ